MFKPTKTHLSLFRAPKASLIAAAIATTLMLAACGGSGSDGFDLDASAKATAATTGAAFQINAPLANDNLTGTVVVKGPLATSWTNVTVVDTNSGKTIVNVTPSGGSFLTNFDTTTLTNGVHTWKFTATNSKTGATSVLNLSVNVYNIAGAKADTSSSIFYGANGHINGGGAYSISQPALQLQQLQDLHVKLYRNEVYNQASANNLANVAATFAAGNVTVYPVILSGVAARTSEQDGYNVGYTLGQQTASARKYPYYEVSNELAIQSLLSNVDGVTPKQFDNVKFQKARGIIRGMIDGVKSVDPNGKIVIGGDTWLHYGFYQMLANGTQPDGTSGYPVVNWDITAWHWYSDMGDITNACGGTGCHNVLAELQSYGKPIWLTEFGVRPTYGTDQQIADYMVGTKMMSAFLQLAPTYNIQSIQVYQLYDDPVGGEGNYGLIQNDGKTNKAAYAAFKNFVLANPK
jgi:hypothetical protein